MSLELLALDKARLMVSITPKANQIRAELLALAESVREVTTDDQMNEAIGIAGGLKGLIRQVEASRKDIQEPLRVAERNINDVAKKYCDRVKAAAATLERMAGEYKAEQDRKAEVARQELARIAEESRRAEQELAKKAQEALLAAEAAKDPYTQNELRQRATDLEIEAGEVADQFAQKFEAADAAAPVEAKPLGAAVVQDYDIQIVDLRALYAAYPQCVSLSPRLLAIKDLIRVGKLDIPGVKLTPRTRVVSRVSMPRISAGQSPDVVTLQ